MKKTGHHLPKKRLRKEVAAAIRAIFNAPNREEAERLLSLTVQKYKNCATDLSDWMENAISEGFTVFMLPSAHQRRLRTSNLAERINKEMKRRTKVVGIFPNPQSCERLVSALLIEIDEEWQQGKTYLTVDEETGFAKRKAREEL